MPGKSFSSMGAGEASLGLWPLWYAMTKGSWLFLAFLMVGFPVCKIQAQFLQVWSRRTHALHHLSDAASPSSCDSLRWDRSFSTVTLSMRVHTRHRAWGSRRTASYLVFPSVQVEPSYYCHFFWSQGTEYLRKHQSIAHNLFIWCQIWFLDHPATADPSPKPPFIYDTLLQWGNIMSMELLWELCHLEFEGTLKIM